MREQVLPDFKARFQAYDPVKYANFGCGSCHGPNAAARNYAMPNPDSEPLPLDGTLAYARKQDSKATEFMLDSIHPRMAELLGEPRYSETEPNGFRCTRCHAVLP